MASAIRSGSHTPSPSAPSSTSTWSSTWLEANSRPDLDSPAPGSATSTMSPAIVRTGGPSRSLSATSRRNAGSMSAGRGERSTERSGWSRSGRSGRLRNSYVIPAAYRPMLGRSTDGADEVAGRSRDEQRVGGGGERRAAASRTRPRRTAREPGAAGAGRGARRDRSPGGGGAPVASTPPLHGPRVGRVPADAELERRARTGPAMAAPPLRTRRRGGSAAARSRRSR